MKANGEGAVATAPAKNDTVGALIQRLTPQLEKALPKHVTADRMARVALTAIRQNPKLQAADPMSLIASVMVAAQLGLEPNTPLGQCYLIPYNDKRSGRVQAQFQLGYKGILDLSHRSGQYRRIAAYGVDAADEFDFAYGLEPFLTHVPARKPSGEVIYYYAAYELDNGGKDFRVWSKEKVEEHARKYSQAFRSGKTDSPWSTAFDSMAKKTVLVDLLRYAPKSIEVQQGMGLADATALDGASLRVREDDPDMNITAEWEEVKEADPEPEQASA
jgi:recombination protein RecT